MILRPQLSDYRLISHYIGKVIIGTALIMLIPLLTALSFREWNPFFDFLITIGASLLVGILFLFLGKKIDKDVRWIHGMVIAAFSWIIAVLLGAIPHFLSGHFLSFLDACFDLMSGYTTTGLTLIQNLDHVSYSLNMWRHILTYVGGQGMIVVVLTFLIRGTAGAYMMYVGEGKDERLLPNIIQTSRAIWMISTVYLLVGTTLLSIVTYLEGLRFPRAFLHGLWLFMTSWSTGGFSAHSQNVLYYHSLAIETITMVLFILGSFNFILHYAVWSGKRFEFFKNIEIISFISTVTITFSLVTFALIKLNIYPELFALFRKGFYILLSGHTGTGNTTIYAQQFLDWGPLAMLAIAIAMAIGGSASSTCGGIKGLRVGLFFKGISQEIKRIVLSENSVFVTKFHHIKDIILTDQHIKMAGLVILCFILIYFGGALLGVAYGYPFMNSLFDSISAGSTTGLSCGVTSAAMPTPMKLYYIFAMWAGRLEFISVFGLIAFISAMLRGK
ncbi:TrkH family potassium uptake protein [Candidatus Margulisiibacteriota bacterium]